MELREVDPNDISVSEMNERVETDMGGGVEEDGGSLQASVDKLGVIQPPLVRLRNGDGEGTTYEVIVGQRRTLAAQSAKDRGKLDTIHVFVVDWDDGEALEASITENIDTFREDVGRQDRAVAINRLMQLKNLKPPQVADRLGVSPATVRKWLEYTREEWKGTSIEPKYEQSSDEATSTQRSVESTSDQNTRTLGSAQLADTLSTGTVEKVRRMTGGGKEGEAVLQKVAEAGLGETSMEEVEQRVNRGQDVETAIQEVKQSQEKEGGISVHTRIVFTGQHAEALERAAVDRATSDDEIVRIAVTDWLDREGYL